MKIKRKKKKVILVFLIVLTFLIIPGCAVLSPVGDFTARQYQNLVGYFNTYYNAKTAFNLGVEAVNSNPTSVSSNTPGSNPTGGNSSSGNSAAVSSKYPQLPLLNVMGLEPATGDAKINSNLSLKNVQRF